nr:MAG TPA: hypothetical protein [Caudoviricetes sp.]
MLVSQSTILIPANFSNACAVLLAITSPSFME